MSISLQETPRVQPTARTELAAFLYKRQPTSPPAKRHVCTVPFRGTGRPRKVTSHVLCLYTGTAFHRFQSPVRLCYATTINKSQGLPLTKAGLDLRGDVLFHGQLFAALKAEQPVETTSYASRNPNVFSTAYPTFTASSVLESIVAATGHPPPAFAIDVKRGISNKGRHTPDGDISYEDNSDSHDSNSGQIQ